MQIKLSPAEVQVGAFVGLQRHKHAIEQKIEYPDGYDNPWQRHIEGALAEMAFAKIMTLHWDAKPDQFDKNDVSGWEVRCTEYKTGHLLLQDTDLDFSPYVLLTGQNGDYVVRGWIFGFQGKLDEYWGTLPRQNRPCYRVPQDKLRPVQTHDDFLNSSYKESA
jgi:hypothetical protein